MVVKFRHHCVPGSEKPGFFKNAQPTGFLGFGLYWVFGFFYLNEQLGSFLVDFTHQLSFYLDSPVLYLKFADSLLIGHYRL